MISVSRRSVVFGASAILVAPSPTGAQAVGPRVLRARTGSARLRGPDGGTSAIRGFDGAVPGPALRVKRGEELRVRLSNELVTDTAIHWHGVRVPNAADGAVRLTQAVVGPGESFDYRFTPPDAGTFWYHASPRPIEDRALYGLLIVDEPEPIDVDRDLALMLDAWPLGADGSVDKDGVTAFTVNGRNIFDIPVVTNERVRLRLINAARNEFMTVRLDRHAATVMAIDGQPAEPFAARDGRLALAPGNRVDVFIDATLPPGTTAPIFVGSDGREVPLARFVYSDAPPLRSAPRAEPKPLPANPLPERMNFAAAIKLEIGLDDPRHQPAAGSFGRPLFTSGPRASVQIGFKNPSDRAHVIHLHGHSARLLDALDDGWKPFWLDTILAPPQRTTRIAFVADNRGKWLIESQVLGGEGGIRAWFEIT